MKMYSTPVTASSEEKPAFPPFTAMMSALGATPAYWFELPPAEPSPAAMPATCEPCAPMSRSLQLPALITAALHSLPVVNAWPPTFPGGVPAVVRSQMYRSRVVPSGCLKSECDQSIPVSNVPMITPLPVAPVNSPLLTVRTRLARMSCIARSLFGLSRRAAWIYCTRESPSSARTADSGTRAPNSDPAWTSTRPPKASIAAGDRWSSDTNTSTKVSAPPGSRRSTTASGSGRCSTAPSASMRDVLSMRATTAASSSGRSNGSSFWAGA